MVNKLKPFNSGCHRVLSIAEHLESVFQEIDDATSEYARRAGIRCPSGCGHCCESNQVEATILEMLPLALRFAKDGIAARWYERLKLLSPSLKKCVLYESRGASKGRCSQYAHRAMICRLFGFAARRNSGGVKEPVMCSVMKTKAMAVNVDAMRYAPVFDTFFRRLFLVYADLGGEQYPINEALRRALEYVLLAQQFDRERTASPENLVNNFSFRAETL